MKLTEFLEAGESRWSELEGMLDAAGRRPERLGAEGVRRLAGLYRAATADLAIARRAFPGDAVVERLERLVLRGRAAIYQGGGRRLGLAEFFGETYWRLVWERRRPLLLAAALLLGPSVLGLWWGLSDPDSLVSRLPPAFLWVTEAGSTDQGYGTGGLIGFSTFVFTNNIRVTLLTFALGVTWGLGTAWVVLQNGVIFGGVTGLAVAAGNWRVFLAAIVAHGTLELSCVVVGGAAGLSLGRSILRPGRLTRRESLAREARAAVQIAAGTAVWLVVAGLLEGFASRTGLGWVPTSIIGAVVGGTFWLLVWRRGRNAGLGPRGAGLAP